jgi:hypothetical protein
MSTSQILQDPRAFFPARSLRESIYMSLEPLDVLQELSEVEKQACLRAVFQRTPQRGLACRGVPQPDKSAPGII